MKPDASILFRSRGEFDEAVLTALAASERDLLLADRDFSDWPLGTVAACTTIEALLRRPGGRVRVLVADPDWLERHGARFAGLRRRFAVSLACRRIPPSLFRGEGALIGDRCHLLRRAHAGQFRGRLTLSRPGDVGPEADRYDALWDESTPCLTATTLGL